LGRAFDSAFRIHTADFPGGSRGLRLVDAGVGTWWMVLDDLSTIYQAAQSAPDATAALAKDLDYVVRVLREQSPTETAAHLRDLAKTLADTGRRLKADAVAVVAAVKVTVRAEHYGVIQRAARPVREGFGEAAVDPPMPRSQKHRVMTALLAAERGELYGTALSAGGAWYARLEGLGGVLLPLHVSGAAERVDGAAYRIEGRRLTSGRGWPEAVQVKTMHKVGSAGRAAGT